MAEGTVQMSAEQVLWQMFSYNRIPNQEWRNNHKIIEWFGWERTFRGHLAQSPCSEQGHLQLDQGAPSPIQPGLERFQRWASTISLGNLCQGFTTLTVKNFFLISSLNLPSLNLKPSSLVLFQQALLERLFPSFLKAPSGTGRLQWGLPRKGRRRRPREWHDRQHFCYKKQPRL